MSSAPTLCANPDCTIAIDGKCIEGLATSTCPNFGRSPDMDEAAEDDPTPRAPTAYDLASSAVLETAAASRLLAARPSRVIGIIATFDAGKTSLIAGVYDAFQRTPVAGMRFAGSSTLHSFEVACHDSRSASRRIEAAMFRTPRGEARFYHLDLCPAVGGEPVTLLIADRAGEEYLKVSAEVANAAPLFEVERADTLTVLVDGERLVDQRERHNVRAEVEGILQGLSDADLLNGRQQLAIALTKHDAVQGSDRRDAAIADFDRLAQNIRRKFPQRFSDIRTFVTAASPKEPEARRGEGLPELLAYWVQPVCAPVEALGDPGGTRDFDLLRGPDA